MKKLKKESKTYSKREIMKLAGLNNDEESYKASSYKVDKVIEFLKRSAPRLLEGSSISFFKKEINIYQDKKQNYDAYEFNTVTTILLVCLLKCHKCEFFKRISNEQKTNKKKEKKETNTNEKNTKYTTEEEAEQWFEEIKASLASMEYEWNRNGDNRAWDVISINLASICYGFTKLERNNHTIEEIEDKVNLFYTRFMALPDDEKRYAYNKVKSRIDYINKTMDKVVKEQIEDRDKCLNSLYKIDLEMIEDVVEKI